MRQPLSRFKRVGVAKARTRVEKPGGDRRLKLLSWLKAAVEMERV
jgi:hypothetical protein